MNTENGDIRREIYSGIFQLARDHLLKFPQVTDNVLEQHLNEWRQGKPNNLNRLMLGLLNSVKNKQGMPNSIGDVEQLRTVLCEFSPKGIREKYEENWQELFGDIEHHCNPPGEMVVNNAKNYWVQFCKSIVSASYFLSNFSELEEFDKFVGSFYGNEYTRIALPLLLKEEIFGFGFALACDFLKENGYPQFVKPDTHIKRIFVGLGLSTSDRDFDVFRAVIRFSECVGEIPYRVDKLFWLVGSGKFYLSEFPPIATNRDRFIKSVKKQYEDIPHLSE